MDYFIGIDIGDKTNFVCVLDSKGNIVLETEVTNDEESVTILLENFPSATVAIEACSHSLWLNALLLELDLKVYVANPRKVQLIYKNYKKTDKEDAKILAKLVRSDPSLLFPIVTRDIETQEDLILLKTRRKMVDCRGDLIRHIRGIIKPFGVKLPKGVTVDNFHVKAKEYIENSILSILKDTFDAIESLAKQIKNLETKIDDLIKEKYPEANLLQTIPGVGPIISLTFLLIIGDPKRFKKSRDVGAYFGLIPKRDQSGEMDKSLPITKTGDASMRALLVNASHRNLGIFGKDTQLRRHGLKIMGTNENKIRKKKAVIAVARKIAVLMHSILISGEEFKNKVA